MLRVSLRGCVILSSCPEGAAACAARSTKPHGPPANSPTKNDFESVPRHVPLGVSFPSIPGCRPGFPGLRIESDSQITQSTLPVGCYAPFTPRLLLNLGTDCLCESCLGYVHTHSDSKSLKNIKRLHQKPNLYKKTTRIAILNALILTSAKRQLSVLPDDQRQPKQQSLLAQYL